MTTYPKIPTVYLRDPATKYKTVLEGQFATPELEYLARRRHRHDTRHQPSGPHGQKNHHQNQTPGFPKVDLV